MRSDDGAYYAAVVTDDYDGINTPPESTVFYVIPQRQQIISPVRMSERCLTILRRAMALGWAAVSGSSLEMFIDGSTVLGVTDPGLSSVNWAGLASIPILMVPMIILDWRIGTSV